MTRTNRQPAGQWPSRSLASCLYLTSDTCSKRCDHAPYNWREQPCCSAVLDCRKVITFSISQFGHFLFVKLPIDAVSMLSLTIRKSIWFDEHSSNILILEHLFVQ